MRLLRTSTSMLIIGIGEEITRSEGFEEHKRTRRETSYYEADKPFDLDEYETGMKICLGMTSSE